MPRLSLLRHCRDTGLSGAVGRTLLVLALAGVSSAGCYRYQPINVAEMREGESVRLDLSAVAVDRVRRASQQEARVLSGFNVMGRVARMAGDSLTLSVAHAMLDANARPLTINQDLHLLRSDVQGAHQRRLDRTRSMWTGAILGTAIVASTVFALQRGGRSTGGTTTTPSAPEVRIPLGLGWLMRGWASR
jgi:hypothetical protein